MACSDAKKAPEVESAPLQDPPAEARAADPAPSAAPATLQVDGRSLPIASVLVWEEPLPGGGSTPQIAFYTDSVTCAQRGSHDGPRVYGALLGPLETGAVVEVPNWGYSGKADHVPLASARLKVLTVTAGAVAGEARFSSEPGCGRGPCADGACPEGTTCHAATDVCRGTCGFELSGSFEAVRCS